MVAGVGVALVISSFWKISIHAACAAGTVAILVVVFGWIMLIWVPVVAAICWARVTLRDHTALQVVAGSAVGAIVATAVMVPWPERTQTHLARGRMHPQLPPCAATPPDHAADR